MTKNIIVTMIISRDGIRQVQSQDSKSFIFIQLSIILISSSIKPVFFPL